MGEERRRRVDVVAVAEGRRKRVGGIAVAEEERRRMAGEVGEGVVGAVEERRRCIVAVGGAAAGFVGRRRNMDLLVSTRRNCNQNLVGWRMAGHKMWWLALGGWNMCSVVYDRSEDAWGIVRVEGNWSE